MVYLDNAATTFPKPEVVYRTVDYVQRNSAVNIGRGSYQVANDAMQMADDARYLLAGMVGINNPNNVVLTPSATLAANEIIFGLEWDEYKTVYVTPFEHNAIARPLNYIRQQFGINIVQLPFNPVSQRFDVDKAKLMFSKQMPDYIFINQISNVTGVITPVKEIAELAQTYQSKIIVDGSQSLGLLDINMQRDGIDYLIFAGHKNIYASWGVGGFVCKDKCNLRPVLAGGTGSDSLNLSMGSIMPTCFEPGSSNIIAIASLQTALKWLKEESIERIDHKKRELMKVLVDGLKSRGCKLYLPESEKIHSSVLSFNIEGYTANEIGTILNQDFDIAVRTGYHCAPYIHEFLDTISYGGTVRVSVGYFNTMDDIETLLCAVDDL